MNYSNKRKLSSPVPSLSNKWQRLDGSMINNQNISTEVELTTTTGSFNSSSSSSEGGDTNEQPVVNNLSCGQAAAQSSSLSTIDNILSSNNNNGVSPNKLIKQPAQTHPEAAQPNNTQVAANPQETSSSSATNTIAPSQSIMAATAAAALRCNNKKSMVQSPNDFFTANLRSRGYPATTFCSLKSGYHNTPTVS